MIQHLHWGEVYSVGIREFDEDHQILFRWINTLIDEIRRGNQGALVQEILDHMLEDVVLHFEKEEAALEKANFPDLGHHREDHYILLRSVLKFKNELKYDRLDSEKVVIFLVDWVTAHIKDQDMKYKPFLEAT
ncbi:MAG: bacteriohemerythrin [bacterium]